MMMAAQGTLLQVVLLATFATFAVRCASNDDYPFRNTSLPWDDRVTDLVRRLTVDEVIEQLAKGGAGKNGGPAPAIPRLGIKPYQWNTECLRGDADDGNATAFPQSLGLAAAFSTQLIQEIAVASSTEVRANHNNYAQQGNYGDHTGLSCFSPVINIMRHPLWGRNQETYGEDPFLNGLYSQFYVKGLHGGHPRYVRTSSGCKHFDVHNGPENIPVSRFAFNAVVSERDWRSTFLPQFKMCVEAGTYSVMCSYNRVNGVPSCANKKLLNDILRKEWGFNGYVVSDEMAIENIIVRHKYLNNSVDTAAACVNAGCNLELSATSDVNDIVYMHLGEALKLGKVTKDLLYERLKPLFYTRMRLGEFDPPSENPYTKLDLSVIQSPEHQELAITAAMQTFVLLKNDMSLLPIPAKTVLNTAAIVGPMADNIQQIMGDYAANVDPKFVITPRKGLSGLANKVNYASGCDDTHCKKYSVTDIKAAVAEAEATVVCLGTGQAVEAEGNDRPDMDLPGQQRQLLKDAIQYSTGPVILVVFSAGPVDISVAQFSDRVPVIIQAFFPAQGAGEALRRVFTMDGAASNPAARLPYTWYASMDQVVEMTNYSMENRTYRYFPGEPLYPFGYGLSYTAFNYTSLVASPSSVAAGKDISLTVGLQNVGKYKGDEVIQVYISWVDSKLPAPQRQLVGFQRVTLDPMQTGTYTFTVKGEQMALWDDKDGFVIQPGTINVFVGGQQPGQKVKVPSNVLQKSVTIIPA